MQKIVLFFFLSISVLGIAKPDKYATQINSKKEFDQLSGLPISNKYGQIDAVKVVFDLESNTLFFLDAQFFEFHHEFCREVLKDYQNLGQFNESNYTESDQRKYLLGNLNFVHHTQEYFLELSPSDLMNLEHIQTLYSHVIQYSYLDSNLTLILNSQRLQNLPNLIDSLPLLSTTDLFNSLEFQAVYKAQGEGRIRFVTDLKEEYKDLKKTDIIVLKKTPLQLPEVAGIIISEFQTPLSHITLLGQNRRIPIMALKNAQENEALKKWNHQLVRFQVKTDTFFIESIDHIEAENKNNKTQNLKFDLNQDSLVVLDKVHRKSYKYIGHKAHNFSELAYISRNSSFKTPESAFAIPFYHYQKHIEKSGAKELINKLLFYKAHHTEYDSIKVILRAIRNKIRFHEMDSRLAKEIGSLTRNLGPYRRLRFRSSTNAEDMKGFSGAGLYASKTGVIDNVNKPVDEAVKKVWASLWSFEAFMEREIFHINQRSVYMGVLCHRAFPDEEVNGVAITANLYRDSYFGYVVNAQLGNENVVNPSKGVICDQFICYPSILNNMYDENNTIEIIAVSNLNEGQMVMTEAEIKNLANQLYRIKNHFFQQSYHEETFNQFAMDVEFKLDKESRQLYIKQAREYTP